MIKALTFAARHPGPKFLVMGAIHGNEKCGTHGINRVIGEIEDGTLKITRGQVTFIPIANPRAYAEDRRQIDRNLNRYLVPMDKPDCYEAELGNVLCPYLAACDVHLAIHSYTVGGEPFIFVARNAPAEQALAASLGPHTLLTGWAEAYAATGRKANAGNDEESTGTIEYARRHGAIAVNIECGQHKDPEAPHVAYRAIRNALRFLGMTGEAPAVPTTSGTRLVTVTHVYYRDDEGHFAKAWKHLENVDAGTTIAHRADGSPITAPENGFIIMPKADCPLGEEWFYFGVETSSPS